MLSTLFNPNQGKKQVVRPKLYILYETKLKNKNKKDVLRILQRRFCLHELRGHR